MLRTVFTVAAVAMLIAVLWQARSALMLIYVSAIVAMGFSPLVRVIENPRRRAGAPRVRRTFAILAIYLTIIAAFTLVALAVVPPMVDQAGELWSRAPKVLGNVQTFLMSHRLMTHRVTLEEAVQN